MRILELLIQKDEEAVKNIGDPAALMGVYDIEAEIEKTAAALEAGQPPETFAEDALSATPAGQSFNVLDFIEKAAAEPLPENRQPTGAMPSLFADDFDYAEKALERLSQSANTNLESEPANRLLRFTIPEDLKNRFRYLPREIWPADGKMLLTDDTDKMQAEVKRCRKDDQAWPKLHYLWPLHPAVAWLNDKVLAGFRRHQAPVLTLPTLAPKETVYILTGLIPNLKGQPLIQEWMGITLENGQYQRTEAFDSLLDRTALSRQTFSNPVYDRVDPGLQDRLPEIVQQAEQWMLAERQRFEDNINQQLDAHLKKLETLRSRHLTALRQYIDGLEVAKKTKQRRAREKEREIQALFDEYMQWIEDTMTTEKQAYIKVVAVLQGVLNK